MIKYFLITLPILCVATVNAQNIKTYKEGPFLYRVHFTPSSRDRCTVDSIIVITAAGNKRVQTIIVPENSTRCDDRAQLLRLEDWNFDGLKDVGVTAGASGANIDSYFWLYDKTSRKFIRSSQMEAASPSSINKKDKSFLTYYRQDAGTHYENTYKWFGHDLQMIKSVKKISTDDEYVTVITQQLTNGKMKIISKKKVRKSEIEY